MHRLRIHRKEPVYFGFFLIATGVLFRRLVELVLVSDMRIESPLYIALIGVVQLLAIGAGTYLVIKQPAIRPPKKTELALVFFSILLTFVSLEIVARLWLNFLATPEQYDRYVLFTSIDAQDFAWTPHPYLTYYPTPNYRKGFTSHN